jgi:hypothetical protein
MGRLQREGERLLAARVEEGVRVAAPGHVGAAAEGQVEGVARPRQGAVEPHLGGEGRSLAVAKGPGQSLLESELGEEPALGEAVADLAELGVVADRQERSRVLLTNGFCDG